jgi:hypothetical protein
MTMIAWVRRHGPVVAIEVIANLAAPALIYALLRAQWGEVPALLASSAPPLLWSLIGLVRRGRIDALSMIVLVGIALSLVALAGGGSVRFLQLRERLVTALIGMTFIVSALIGRPLIGPLARATVARESADALAAFDARRGAGDLHHTIMVMTWVWGLGLMADCALSVVLIYTLSVAQYLIAGPIVGYATMGGLAGWTVLYRRHRARLGRQPAAS